MIGHRDLTKCRLFYVHCLSFGGDLETACSRSWPSRWGPDPTPAAGKKVQLEVGAAGGSGLLVSGEQRERPKQESFSSSAPACSNPGAGHMSS